MCGNCGCDPVIHRPPHAAAHSHGAVGNVVTLDVLENILGANDVQAAHNRARIDAAGALAVNLMSSPGAGKTRLLEVTAEALGAARMAVIEGDLETENDAKRLRARGVQAHQITTGMACHLDAAMVAGGLDHLDIGGRDYLFIENVGNLVCPANFDLGQHLNVVLLAVTEGDDKPEKYPVMFRAADLVLITKLDVASAFDDFDLERACATVRRVQPRATVLTCSARTGEGVPQWLEWLAEQSASRRAAAGVTDAR